MARKTYQLLREEALERQEVSREGKPKARRRGRGRHHQHEQGAGDKARPQQEGLNHGS